MYQFVKRKQNLPPPPAGWQSPLMCVQVHICFLPSPYLPCPHVCAGMHVCPPHPCMCAGMYVYAWSPEDYFSLHSSCVIHFVFKTGSSIGLEVSTGLMSWPQELAGLHLPVLCWDYMCTTRPDPFLGALRVIHSCPHACEAITSAVWAVFPALCSNSTFLHIGMTIQK